MKITITAISIVLLLTCAELSAAEKFDVEKTIQETKARPKGVGLERLGKKDSRAEADKVIAIFEMAKDSDEFVDKVKEAFPKNKVGVHSALDETLDPKFRLKEVIIWFSDRYYGMGVYFDSGKKVLLNYYVTERGD